MTSTPEFPTAFNSTAALTDYAKSVGMIFGGFGIVALLLTMVMICVFVKFCCTSPKDSQEFKKKIHLGIAVGFSVVAVVGCGVGWGYNKQCNDGVTSMTGAVTELFNSSANLIDNIDLTIINISAALDSKTKKLGEIQFSGLMAPIDQILVEIDIMQAKTNNFSALTDAAIANVTEIKDELYYIDDAASEVEPPLEDVPSPDDIPNIDNTFADSIQSGNNSINDMRNTTLNVKQTVNNSVTDIADHLIGNLNAQTDNYHAKVNDLTNSFDNMRNELDNFETEYDSQYKTQINKYSEQRTSVVNAILILPIVVALMSGVGVFFRMPKVLAITCALSFICFFWYVLIAGVNYTLFVVTSGFCAKQSTIVNSVLGNMNSQFIVPGTNNSYPTGQKIGELIQCSGDTTLIGVFEVGFLITDLETQVRSQAQNISRQAHSTNFDNDYKNATQDLKDYKNSTVSLDYSQGKNLDNVILRLDNSSRTLNTSIVFFIVARDQAIALVDEITMDTEYNGGAPAPSVYYGANNISTLDCNDATWSNTVNHTVLCIRAANATNITALVDLELALYHNITDVEEKVAALKDDISIAEGTQSYIAEAVNTVQGLLDSAYGLTNTFIAQIDDGVEAIYNVIADGANALTADTECSFIGKFYNDFSGGFCDKLSPSLQVIAAMMLLGATTLFGSAVLSAVSIYKIRGSGSDDDDDYEDSKA